MNEATIMDDELRTDIEELRRIRRRYGFPVLCHVTSADNAQRILASGFRDAITKRGPGIMATIRLESGSQIGRSTLMTGRSGIQFCSCGSGFHCGDFENLNGEKMVKPIASG